MTGRWDEGAEVDTPSGMATGRSPGGIRPKRLPIPRWLIRTVWVAHRLVYTVSRGRIGLRSPRPGMWGTLRLHTVGRRSGVERIAILGYVEDGDRLVLMAMNGWDEPDPAWWRNLQASSDATVDLPTGTIAVRARLATDPERARSWAAWDDAWSGELDAWAANRSRLTQLVVLDPR